jgi:hypothetical protein
MYIKEAQIFDLKTTKYKSSDDRVEENDII